MTTDTMRAAVGAMSDAQIYAIADQHGTRYRTGDEEAMSFDKHAVLDFARVIAAHVSGVALPAAGWVEAGLVCQACAGDAPRGKCLNPRCIGGPIVRELVLDGVWACDETQGEKQ